MVLAVESGHRESSESWAEIVRDFTARGLPAPACVIGDGALGLWNAVGQVWPQAAEQRCWHHKRCNVVDAVPLKHQPDGLAAMQRMAAAESVADVEQERQRFHRDDRLRFPKACDRLDRDWARMLTYDQFPKEHWRHLRTTNVVESPYPRGAHTAPSAAPQSVSKRSNAPPRSSGVCGASPKSAFAN